MQQKGVHYIVDAFQCKGPLDDVKIIKKLLKDLVKMVGMKELSKPSVIFYKAKKDINSGVTGIILLNESHISIHTYSNRNEFYFDLFSCRPYDAEIIRKHLKKIFKIGKMKEKTIRRGLIL